ncbi:MAG: hypothetical protein KAV87_36040 [Desulfobacteraceae bacterium]|nr:hypothetical protein [Desulfobacteraceae bacterium]
MIAFVVLSFIAIESSVGMLFQSAGPAFYFVLMHIDLTLIWLLTGLNRSTSRDIIIPIALFAVVLDASMMIVSAMVQNAQGLFPLYNVAYGLFGNISKVLTVLEVLALFSNSLIELVASGFYLANHWIDNIRRLGSSPRLRNVTKGAATR